MNLKFSYIPGAIHPDLGQTWHPWAVALGEDAARYQTYICNVLDALAQTPAQCDELLHALAEVEGGRIGRIETGANDVTLEVSPEGVQVHIQCGEQGVGRPEAQFSFGEWRAALQAWRQFLSMPQKAESEVSATL